MFQKVVNRIPLTIHVLSVTYDTRHLWSILWRTPDVVALQGDVAPGDRWTSFRLRPM